MFRTLPLVLLFVFACRGKTSDSARQLQTTSVGSPALVDQDGDGYTRDVDCDDLNAQIHPDAVEVCNGLDDNCDFQVDNDAVDPLTFYDDLDGDGSGDPDTAVLACSGPPGAVQIGGDCNDANPGLNARDDDADGWSTCDGDCDDGAPELNLDDLDLDGVDTCSGDCDDSDGAVSNLDVDGDGQSGCDGDCDDTDASVDGLDLDGDGFSSCVGDCDDTDASVDLADQDGDFWTTCDGDCDDQNPSLNLDDADGDTWSTCDDDCDDTDGDVSPSDLDLDGQTGCDGDCDDTDASVDGLDADGDGVSSCDGDCDDTSALRYPGAPERCDGEDGDCDGVVDDNAIDRTWWYLDLDGDGYGVTLTAEPACEAPSASHVTVPGDCDDNLVAINPGIPEDCTDGVDNDCSGAVDDCGAAGVVDASDAIRRWSGTSSSDTGEAIGSADHDGDGIDDLLIGSPEHSEVTDREGRGWLIYGGPAMAATGDLATEADAHFTGTGYQEWNGRYISGVGDLDGDGFEELAMGSNEAEDPTGSDDGAVYLFWGSGTRRSGASVLPPPNGTALYGLQQNSTFGQGVRGAGDLDGDGYDDMVFSAPRTDVHASDEGAVYLLYGTTTRPATINVANLPRIEGTDPQGQFCASGPRCLAGGDLDGDGFDDLVASGRNPPANDVYVLYGSAVRAGTLLNNTLPNIHNPLTDGSNDGWGSTLAVLDFTGDGYEDIAVGDRYSSLGANGGGAVWIYEGGPVRLAGTTPHTVAHTLVVGTGSDAMAEDLAVLPDLDGDGDDELLASAPYADGAVTATGAIYLFEGDPVATNRSQLDADRTVYGETEEGDFGTSMTVGDFDGDGAPDLAVGAPRAQSSSGRVYVLSNPFL